MTKRTMAGPVITGVRVIERDSGSIIWHLTLGPSLLIYPTSARFARRVSIAIIVIDERSCVCVLSLIHI